MLASTELLARGGFLLTWSQCVIKSAYCMCYVNKLMVSSVFSDRHGGIPEDLCILVGAIYVVPL